MSRRSSDHASDPVATVDSQDAEESSASSLESLLASCGALQSALRNINDSEASAEEVAVCESTEDSLSLAEEPLTVDLPTDAPSAERESLEASDEIPPESAGWLDSLRHEFRASIDELKSSQSAAAASQSAVLKTLTEIIFQSSTVRDSSDGGLDQKLAEFEDRVLNRIGQMSGLAVAAEARKPAQSSSDASIVAKPERKNPARSWAEIRSDLETQGESSEFGFESDHSAAHDASSESAGAETEASAHECVIDVPQAVDPETLNEQELRAAFHEREEFISRLIGRLRHQYQKSSGHLPAEQLKHMAEHLPQELAAQVLQTLQQLNELARIGELELSLERARLARQLNQLDHSRQLIEHNARQIGLTVEEDGTVLNPQKLTLRTGGSRRWLSKLGFGL